ncbi:MAG: DNA polymerase III subunit alpha [Flavobacteriales bacterium]|nr:DNA polymerase III subunit alpha [Flavobacteriales bacterium]
MYLNCHSYYSLKYGTLSVEELVQEAVRCGVREMVLTDINNTSAAFDFVKECETHGIRPALGIEFRNEQDEILYIGLAHNNEGYAELCRMLSKKLQDEEELPEEAPALKHCSFIYPLEKKDWNTLRKNEYIGIRLHQINRLIQLPFREQSHKMVMWQPVTIKPSKQKDHYHLHRLLRSIDKNILISKLNSEEHARDNEHMMSEKELREKFILFPEILINTEQLIAQCSIQLEYKSVKNRKHFTNSAADDRSLLHKLAQEGMEYRYGKKNNEARLRVEKELRIIEELGFSAYFLITWDIIKYAQSRGYHHVGRGSGANSIVAYCMGITDVCPIELDLYFERFINPHRTSPPDFDLDFSWDERDVIIDYIFKRYGKEYTAQIATYTTFKGSSIIRELGKVFGLPKEEIDALADHPDQLEQRDNITRAIFKFGKMMENFPNYLGIHAGGIIISEKPLYHYTALQMMPKGFPIVHWDMYVAEDIGFYKYDILSQRGLGHIKDAVETVLRNQKIHIDIHDVKLFKRDAKVKQQIRSANTIGCFYIESPAMRQLLTKLRCDNYLTLVAASSIIRPGVASSGMMKAYIERFHHPESFEYLHPKMKELLSETYGVMVYQEDVIKVAHHFAGIDLADADILRRAMSGKYRGKGEMERITETFFRNCRERGYPEEISKEVWRQIESFSGYSFSKAHSASFAVESFQSLYLKTYFPLEFMVGVINNFGGFYRTELYVHEARMSGASIEAPCINKSKYLTDIEGQTIWLGFVHMTHLEKKSIQLLLEERNENGPYQSLSDLVERIPIALEQLILLIRVGALRFSGKSKQELLWQAHFMFNGKKRSKPSNDLFRTGVKQFDLPAFDEHPLQQAYDEIELLGFPLCGWFELAKTSFRGDIGVEQMREHLGESQRMLGYLVTTKPVRTKRGELMYFGCFIDHHGKFFDTVHFPDTLRQYPFKGNGVYLLKGKIVEEFGACSLEVEKMEKMGLREIQGE